MNKEIFSYYWFFQQYSIRIKLNGLFYYLRKLPLVGKKIPTTFYQMTELKEVLFYLGLAISVFAKIIFKFIWLGLFILIASFIPGEGETLQQGLLLWGWFVLVMYGFFMGIEDMFSGTHLTFVKSFHVSRTIFARSIQLVEIFYDGLCYLPVFLVLTFMGHMSLVTPLVGVLLYVTMYTLWRYVGRLLKDLRKFVKNILLVFFEIVMATLAIVVIIADYLTSVSTLLFSWPGFIGVSLLAVLVFWLFLTYKNENEYLTLLFARSLNGAAEVKKALSGNQTYLAEGTKMQEKIEWQDSSSLNKLSGERYLNALLFMRYQKSLNKEILLKLLGILAVGAVAVGISLWQEGIIMTEKEVLKMLPALFFLMYMLTFGRKIVQMCFLNCDSAMLNYPFYRTSETILKGFLYRFRRTFVLNGLLTLAIFVSILGFHFANGQFLSLPFFGLLLFLLVSLAGLFSFHELFIYYILQPFTEELEVKNPLYKLATWLFYMFSYMNLVIDVSSFSYVILISIFSLLYVMIGLVLLWKLAPRTFKLKN